MSDDREYVREFIIESREGLDRIDADLVALEAAPGDKSRLNAILRTLHTIKGNSGFLNLPKLGEVAHAGETLLNKLAGGARPFDSSNADLMLRLMDMIRRMLVEIETTGHDAADNGETLKQQLLQVAASINEDSSGPMMAEPRKTRSADSSPLPVAPPKKEFDSTIARAVDLRKSPAAPLPTLPDSMSISSESLLSDSSTIMGLPSRVTNETSSVIRVQINQLDDLMNLVGELVLTRNQIIQITANRPDDELTEPIQRLNRLMAALQDGVMRTRMQPVGNAWRKYSRIVRDLARQCGKQVELELQGADTELDKSMLEAISDPLVHLVRNAVDHGIEKPYLRKMKNKPETGRLCVRAFQESGQVHIEVSDDGAGLNLERIRQRAVEVGVLTAEQAMVVSERDLQNSVFLAGFSTAERVTNISGRGVGMDVVKTSIEQIGGTIELQTREGAGTTIRLTVPLTLAIVPAQVVTCGGQRFAIPQLNVVELLRLRGDDRRAFEHFHDSPVLRLRGELLPVVDLARRLDIEPRDELAQRDALDLLVLKSGTRRFAMLVDNIGDSQEIVAKPLGELLAHLPEYTGAAMTGNGGIALILDVLGLARGAGLMSSDQTLLSGQVTIGEDAAGLDEQVLVCRVDGERQIALPLTDVVRLENIPRESIEPSASGDVVQYRGDVLPLRSLSRHDHRPARADADSNSIRVIIYHTRGQQVGLVVDRIVDVAPRPSELRRVDPPESSGPCSQVTATAIVLGRVTDFLEVI